MSCKFCGKVFSRGINLRRHEREYCSLKDRSSQEMNLENDFSSDRSESLTTTNNESESAEQLDPWIPLIEEAKQRSISLLRKLKKAF